MDCGSFSLVDTRYKSEVEQEGRKKKKERIVHTEKKKRNYRR